MPKDILSYLFSQVPDNFDHLLVDYKVASNQTQSVALSRRLKVSVGTYLFWPLPKQVYIELDSILDTIKDRAGYTQPFYVADVLSISHMFAPKEPITNAQILKHAMPQELTRHEGSVHLLMDALDKISLFQVHPICVVPGTSTDVFRQSLKQYGVTDADTVQSLVQQYDHLCSDHATDSEKAARFAYVFIARYFVDKTDAFQKVDILENRKYAFEQSVFCFKDHQNAASFLTFLDAKAQQYYQQSQTVQNHPNAVVLISRQNDENTVSLAGFSSLTGISQDALNLRLSMQGLVIARNSKISPVFMQMLQHAGTTIQRQVADRKVRLTSIGAVGKPIIKSKVHASKMPLLEGVVLPPNNIIDQVHHPKNPRRGQKIFLGSMKPINAKQYNFKTNLDTFGNLFAQGGFSLAPYVYPDQNGDGLHMVCKIYFDPETYNKKTTRQFVDSDTITIGIDNLPNAETIDLNQLLLKLVTPQDPVWWLENAAQHEIDNEINQGKACVVADVWFPQNADAAPSIVSAVDLRSGRRIFEHQLKALVNSAITSMQSMYPVYAMARENDNGALCIAVTDFDPLYHTPHIPNNFWHKLQRNPLAYLHAALAMPDGSKHCLSKYLYNLPSVQAHLNKRNQEPIFHQDQLVGYASLQEWLRILYLQDHGGTLSRHANETNKYCLKSDGEQIQTGSPYLGYLNAAGHKVLMYAPHFRGLEAMCFLSPVDTLPLIAQFFDEHRYGHKKLQTTPPSREVIFEAMADTLPASVTQQDRELYARKILGAFQQESVVNLEQIQYALQKTQGMQH